MKKVIVTGHSRGLGAAIAETLLARDIAVLGISRSVNRALGVQYPDLLRQYALDLADIHALTGWIDGGALDRFLSDASQACLVNNAGLLQPVGPPGGQGARAIAQAVSVNVAAPLMLTDAFARAAASVSDRRVLHISSGAARSVLAGWSVYCATKAALDQHARAVVADAIAGLRIVSLAPGVVDTDMQAEIRASETEKFPLRGRFRAMKEEGSLASPRETAHGIVEYMMSEAFGEVTDADLRTL
jgi:NAD(P)-dependent dehydrogenase (short-subunit alcohol dehydrogenase family)